MLSALKRTFGFFHIHPLARRHLFYAYYNFIKWQVISRLNKDLVKMLFIENVSFYAKKRLTGITGNIYTGLQEFNDMGFLLHFLRKDDLFYDIGANVGSYTLLASGVCQSQTVAFEPVKETFEILYKNIELNNLQNIVTLENKGVGDKPGELLFSTDCDTTNHVLNANEPTENSNRIPVVNLDLYCKEYIPSLIKIDVEGYEVQVLDGAQELLSNPNLKAIIIEIIGGANFYGLTNSDIDNRLLEHNFKSYKYDPFTRKLIASVPNTKSNTIYIKDLDFVQERLATAKYFTVFNETI